MLISSFSSDNNYLKLYTLLLKISHGNFSMCIHTLRMYSMENYNRLCNNGNSIATLGTDDMIFNPLHNRYRCRSIIASELCNCVLIVAYDEKGNIIYACHWSGADLMYLLGGTLKKIIPNNLEKITENIRVKERYIIWMMKTRKLNIMAVGFNVDSLVIDKFSVSLPIVLNESYVKKPASVRVDETTRLLYIGNKVIGKY